MHIDEVVDAIAKMDTNKITPEKAELLKNDFLPTDEEKELIKERKEAGSKLAPLDIFLDTLAGVERVRPRLTLIILMDTCGEALARIAPASMSVMVASNALMASTKLAKILEVILAFGNRMNSNRRGGAWGFKLSAFDRLIDTKTNDRKRTLMHFVCTTVQKTESEAAAFASELVDINAAAAVSLQDLKNQLAQAQRTIAQVATELEKDPENESMKAFQTEYEPMVAKAAVDLEEAVQIFQKALAYFAETTLTEPSAFFAVFVRLCKTYAEAEKDNVKWARQAAKEKEALEAAARKSALRSGVAIDGTGESTADGPDEHSETAPEGAVSPQRGHLRQVNDVQDGTLDALISEMKTTAFRRPEGHNKRETRRRMSMRRENNNNSYASARPWLK